MYMCNIVYSHIYSGALTQDNRYCGTDTHTILWRLLLVYPAGQPASVSERISETAYTWTYVWRRIHPGSAEQLDHGHRIGQLTGKGINSSDVATVKDTNLISEQQTDFIFSAVGEELGFMGSVIIIAILLLIVLQCIRVARRSGDKKGMYIATGMAALVSIQSFINIGVATSILPNTGLPLPFISYGLSSLVSLCAGMGMVLNINLQKKKY